MFIKKAVNVVAAASVAVLGVVGAVSAQSPLTNMLPEPIPSGTMGVSFEVQMVATMAVEASMLKDKSLFVDDPTTQGNANNLGSILVKTNYPKWDVTVAAKSNLVLTKGGTEVCPPPSVFEPNPTCVTTGADSLFVSGGPGTGGTPAVLDVYVSIVSGGGPVYNQTRTRLTPTLNSTGKASFAVGIGGTVNSATLHASANIQEDVGTDIVANGFGPQKDYSTGVLFYVAGGLISGTTASIMTTPVPVTDGGTNPLKGKNNGNYTEDLEFTLVAAY